MHILNDEEQEKCRISTGLYKVSNDKFTCQNNEIMFYCNTVN